MLEKLIIKRIDKEKTKYNLYQKSYAVVHRFNWNLLCWSRNLVWRWRRQSGLSWNRHRSLIGHWVGPVWWWKVVLMVMSGWGWDWHRCHRSLIYLSVYNVSLFQIIKKILGLSKYDAMIFMDLANWCHWNRITIQMTDSWLTHD